MPRTVQAALYGGGTLSLLTFVPGNVACRAVMFWPADGDSIEGAVSLGAENAVDNLEIVLAAQDAAQAEADLAQHLQGPSNP